MGWSSVCAGIVLESVYSRSRFSGFSKGVFLSSLLYPRAMRGEDLSLALRVLLASRAPK
jgi:hypothetical protein